MGWHCDASYNNDGLFKNIAQVENPLVIIVTYGHNRILNQQRVAHISKGWVADQTWSRQSTIMNDLYILLHPSDEKLYYNDILGQKSRYHHGNIRLKKMKA